MRISRYLRTIPAAVLALGIAVAASGAAEAQTAPADTGNDVASQPDIIVTATKRNESLDQVAMPISAVIQTRSLR